LGTIYATAAPQRRLVQLICDPDDHDGLTPSDELGSCHPDLQMLSAAAQLELLPTLHCLFYKAKSRMATGVLLPNHSSEDWDP
jgi:hypothetical protein